MPPRQNAAALSLEAVLRATLRDVVVEVFDERLAELAPTKAGPPPLLDRAGLAEALNVSTPTIDKLRKRPGFPRIRICDVDRFDLARVRVWFDENPDISLVEGGGHR